MWERSRFDERKGKGVVDMGNKKSMILRQRVAAKYFSCTCKDPCLPRNSLVLKLICNFHYVKYI